MLNSSHLFRKAALATLTLAFLYASAAHAQRTKEVVRLQNAGVVVSEATKMPENLPSDLISKADCIVIVPSTVKAAFIFGANYGRGAMTCRTGSDFKGHWGAPLMVALGGVNFGLQIGGQATDYILTLSNARGAESLLSSKVKLNADAAGSAFTKGRHAEAGTDLFMRAHILAYSRSRGVFTGVSVAACSLRPDRSANLIIYGKDIAPREILFSGNVKPPQASDKMLDLLNSRFPQNKSTTTAANVSGSKTGAQ